MIFKASELNFYYVINFTIYCMLEFVSGQLRNRDGKHIRIQNASIRLL